MEKDTRIRITLYPSKELKNKIEALAKAEDRKVNNFVMRLIKKSLNFVEAQKVKKIKNKKKKKKKIIKIHPIM